MSKYRILQPVIFMQGNKAIRYTREADLVQIDDATAKQLGDKVELRGQDAVVAPEQSAEQAQAVAVPKMSKAKGSE